MLSTNRMALAVLTALTLVVSTPVPAAQAAGSTGSINVKIQGYDKLSSSWTPGNTAGYAEKEAIPFRTVLANGSAAATVTSLELVFDNLRGGVPGIEDLQSLQVCAAPATSGPPGGTAPCSSLAVVPAGSAAPPGSAAYAEGPSFRTVSGTKQGVYTLKRLALAANETRVVTWGAVLALGSHGYPGSALHMQIGAAAVNGATVSFGSKDVPIPVNQIIATATDKKINGADSVSLGVGATATVTIKATTFGPSGGTQDLTVTDDLPACDDYVLGSASPAPSSRTPDPDESLTWRLAGVPNRTTVTLTFTIRAVQPGDCRNHATTTSTSAPPTDDTVPQPVLGRPDVGIDKACSPDEVSPGGVATCTLSYANNGTTSAPDVRITDVLGTGLTYVAGSASPAPTGVSGQTLTWSLGALAAGTSGTITYQQRVPATGPAGTLELPDTATISTYGQDSNPDNDEDTEITTVTYAVDLAVTKTCPTSTTPGAPAQQKVTYTNQGSATATNASITDTLPAGMTYVAGSASRAPTAVSGQTIVWELGSLAPGASGSITYDVTVSGGSALTNTARISSDQPDAEPGDNTATCTTGISYTDVHLTKQCPTAVSPGQVSTHVLTFGNEGNAPAAGVTITDTLGAGLAYRGGLVAKVNGATVTPTVSQNGQVLTFGVGSLPAGATGTLSYDVQVPATAAQAGTRTFTDSATIATTSAESDTSDNASGDCVTTVDYQPLLTLSKSACPAASVVPGGTLSYTLSYANTGTAPARSSVLTDEIPSGTSPAGNGGGTLADGVVTWSIGDLAPGASSSKQLRVLVTATGGSVINTARLTSPDSPTRTASTTTPVSAAGASTTGSAFPLSAGLLGLTVVPQVYKSATSAPSGQAFDNDALLSGATPPSIPGVLQVGLLSSASSSDVDASGASSTASSRVADVNLLGGLVTAKVVAGVSQSNATATGGSASRSGTTLAGLRINGTDLANAGTNVKVNVLGIAGLKVAEAYLNEESKSVTTSNGKFVVTHRVNAVRVRLLVPLGPLPAGADIVLGHAESTATYPAGLPCGAVPSTVSGRAYTAFVGQYLLGTSVLLGEAEISPLGGSASSGTPAGVAPVATTGTALNKADGDISVPTSSASSHTENLSLLGGLVTAKVLDTTAASPSAASTNLGFTFLGLVVAGQSITGPVPPNTTLAIPQPDGTLVTVVLNEQRVVTTADGRHTEGTVNAVHVYVAKGSALLTEVVVSSAHSDAHRGG